MSYLIYLPKSIPSLLDGYSPHLARKKAKLESDKNRHLYSPPEDPLYLTDKLHSLAAEVEYLQKCQGALVDLQCMGSIPAADSRKYLHRFKSLELNLGRDFLDLDIKLCEGSTVQEEMPGGFQSLPSRSSSEEKERVEAVFKLYGAARVPMGGMAQKFCHLLGRWLPAHSVCAYPLAPKRSFVHLFGCGLEPATDPRNGMSDRMRLGE